MATTTIKNGVDVDQLVQTIGAIQEDPNVASFTFKAKTSWEEGGTSRGAISSYVHMGQEQEREAGHVLTGDEPPVLLGRDKGPNAVELVLAALGFCFSVGFVYNAAARGIDLEELSYELEGDLDLRNFVGIAEGPRPGFTEIRVKAKARASNATIEELADLCKYVQDTSPVGDIVSNAVPLKVSISPV